MIILAGEGTYRQHTLDLLAEEGVAADRVTFVANQPREQYLEYYHDIDIGLDTVPYNGHTTSLDSFWMGVPVVTLVGPTVVGRAGLCQLMNLGLPELIASSPEHYVRVAAELAHDLPRFERPASDPARSDAGFPSDGRPTLRPEPGGGLPCHMEAVVPEVDVHWGLSRFSRRGQRYFGNKPPRRENGTVPLAPPGRKMDQSPPCEPSF